MRSPLLPRLQHSRRHLRKRSVASDAYAWRWKWRLSGDQGCEQGARDEDFHHLRGNRKGPEDNLNGFPCPLLLQVRGRPSACLLVAHLYRPPPGGGPPTWQVGACAGQSSPRAAAAALPSDREYIGNRTNEIASTLGAVPEHLPLEKKTHPRSCLHSPMCSEPQKVHFAPEWTVLSGDRSCWGAFFSCGSSTSIIRLNICAAWFGWNPRW
jgi:hypothetical protein